MTGFARAEGSLADGQGAWVWEARSVNGKGLDVRLRLPPGAEALEPAVRKRASARMSRGNVTLALHLTQAADAQVYKVNEVLLDSLIDIAMRKSGAERDRVAPPRIDALLAVKGVVEAADNTFATDAERDARHAELLAGLDQALDKLSEARAAEGVHLGDMLSRHLETIDKLTADAAALAALQPAVLRERLKAQVDALLESSSKFSEDRLAQEAAVLATKADVREELDRLTAHVSQGRTLLENGDPCGRKLEFLSQEFNREANTLCSKSTDVELTRIGLELKAAIDQFREQIQNVE
jgi:uncharacterized protein (TIGR00255 family)